MSDSSVSNHFSNLFGSSTSRNALLVSSIAIGSSLAMAVAILGTQHFTRQKKRKDLADRVRKATSISDLQSLDHHHHTRDQASAASSDGTTPRYLSSLDSTSRSTFNTGSIRRRTASEQWDESLIREQLSRNYSFLGDQGMDQIRNSFVIVVGAGGVGSWAALMLIRSGVSKLRIIDFDQVSLSSLNRHACATLEDVGRPKVICCADKFSQIAPWAKIEPWVELFTASEADRMLSGNPTYVVDAIDNIDTKVELLKYCAENKIKVISSMGAGAKSDPSRVQISDISTTSEDPLARSVRRRLRALGIPPIPPKEAEEQAKTEMDQLDKNHQEPQAHRKKPNFHLDLTGGGSTSTSSGDEGSKLLAAPANSHVPVNSSPFSRSPLELESPLKDSSSDDLTQIPGSVSTTGDLRPTSSVNCSRNPSSRIGHSRRASSASSMASAVYATPLMTPSDELAALLTDTAISDSQATLTPLDSTFSIATTEAATITPSATITSALNTKSSSKTKATNNPKQPTFFIPCVYSTETSDTRLLPLDEEEFQKGNVEELAALEDFRVRILPVLGPIPAMFGLAVATYIICDLAGHKMEPLAFKGRRKLYEKIYSDLSVSESRHVIPSLSASLESKDNNNNNNHSGPRPHLPFNVNDISYLFEEVFRGRSIVPPYDSLSSAQFERWDSTLPISFSNIALFSRKQAKIHETEVLKKGKSPIEVWGKQTYDMWKKRMASEKTAGILRF